VYRLPAEWERQEYIMLTYPHENSDWNCCLKEIKKSYKEIIKAISKYEKCLIICNKISSAKSELSDIINDNILFIEINTNDTWIRDYGAIDVFKKNEIISYDFTFNGWGNKFEAKLDNLVNNVLYKKRIFSNKLIKKEFILEGGSIETNGKGVLLTTSKCLLNSNRNLLLSKNKIETKLKHFFGCKTIIWLENGYLSGDDTDSHIDTLARFLNENTIAYVKCFDEKDEHFFELNQMEKELEKTNFHLIPLPLPHPIYKDKKRLPATYLNFLFINGAILLPIYNDIYDKEVITFFENFYTNIDIIPIDSTALIREHGSIHCATMHRFAKPKDIF